MTRDRRMRATVGGWSALITCEHARFALPPGEDLGLPDAVMRSHVSYDRGARAIATALAGRLDAPLHLGTCSRLWVDLNRRAQNPAVILEETYGLEVPGNRGLDAAARRARLEACHRPYRAAARADAAALADAGGCLHLAIHSFDPAVDPENRRFDAGVLLDPTREPEATVAARIAEGLRARDLDARLDEPYTGVPEGLTSWLRDQLPASRYVGLEIEASQGWMTEPEALEGFAAQLAAVVRDLLADA